MLNAMIYVRGNKKDYDNWQEMGNPGWDYESVLPYFKKSEDMRIEEYRDSPYHRTGGYLTIEYFNYRSSVTDYLIQAGTEMGYDVVDANGPTQTGFSFTHATVKDGLRCSTAKAFLRTASERKNLHIGIKSMVEKILVSQGELLNVSSSCCFIVILFEILNIGIVIIGDEDRERRSIGGC